MIPTMNDNHKDFTIKITIPDGYDFNEEEVNQVVSMIRDHFFHEADFTDYPPLEVALIGRNLRNGQSHGCTCEITSI
jgi:alkyl hydroperoxide reductase subunit AhpC